MRAWYTGQRPRSNAQRSKVQRRNKPADLGGWTLDLLSLVVSCMRMLTDAAIAALTASGDASFAFFPPIRGFAENRWKFQQATRIEFCAGNAAGGEPIWFARGAVAYITVEEGAITLALRRELEYSNGAIWPVRQEGSEEPEPDVAADASEIGAAPRAPAVATAATAGVVRAPLIRRPRPKWSQEPVFLVLAVAGSAALALVIVLAAFHAWLQPPQRADSAPIDDPKLYTLSREDNYYDVVRKLGPPESERPLSLAGSSVSQRALIYRGRNYAVVLLGVEGQRNYAQEQRYIGAIRLSDGAVVGSANMAHDSTTDSLLKLLARQLKE